MSTEDKREAQDDAQGHPETDRAADVAAGDAAMDASEGTSAAEAQPDAIPDAAADDVPATAADAAPDTAEPAPAEPAPANPAPGGSNGSGAGVLSTVAGGALAAVVGFGAAQFVDVDWMEFTGLGADPVAEALDSQSAEIAALRDRLSEVEAAATSTDAVAALIGGVSNDLTERFETVSGGLGDLSGRVGGLGDAVSEQLERVTGTAADAETQFAEVAGALRAVDERMAGFGDRLNTVGERLAAVDERLVAVEKRPLVESSETARAAFEIYERELENLRASLEAQQAQAAEMEASMTTTVATARAQMTAVQEEAEAQLAALRDQSDSRIAEIQREAEARIAAAEAAAAERAERAVAEAALSQVEAALNAGIPYETALPALQAVTEVPAILVEYGATGIPTLLQLQEEFTPLARAALESSITATMSDDPGNRLTAFLRTQTGVRSLEAREGDDPDAVLSRMTTAVADGDLSAALSEYDALPEAGQAALADWADRAAARLAVDTALPELDAALNSN